MKYKNVTVGPLAAQFPTAGLFATWLDGRPIPAAQSAAQELGRGFAAPSPQVMAPLWQVEKFAQQLPAEFRGLPHGPAVVVTGQQPGHLGGPLLIVYKIATTIALARRRTAAGLPTVPVFWSGDDDDDLAEALAPVAWNRQQSRIVRSDGRDQLRSAASQRQVLADIKGARWCPSALAVMSGGDGADDLQADLHQLLVEALAADLPWGTGQVQILARIFQGTDLVIIRGHDADLHTVAAPFYRDLLARLPELSGLVRQRGQELQAAGFSAQISERSLQRPLFRMAAGQRIADGIDGTVAVADLRPGVMLRSPVQDWLLRPVTVVVGPGELAYLRQLDTMYAALELPRSALVPRLTGWVLPVGALEGEVGDLIRPGGVAQDDFSTADVAAMTDGVIAPAQAEIGRVLVSQFGMPADRAATLAEKRALRFRKGLAAMFSDEATRLVKLRLAAAPQWILPIGQRQERSLGLLSALEMWGESFLPAVMLAAEQHLVDGANNSWQEAAIMVPEGTVSS